MKIYIHGHWCSSAVSSPTSSADAQSSSAYPGYDVPAFLHVLHRLQLRPSPPLDGECCKYNHRRRRGLKKKATPAWLLPSYSDPFSSDLNEAAAFSSGSSVICAPPPAMIEGQLLQGNHLLPFRHSAARVPARRHDGRHRYLRWPAR